VAIRNLLFRPDGGGIFAGDPRWIGVGWTRPRGPLLVVSPSIDLRFPDGRRDRALLFDPFPDYPEVVWLDSGRRMMLDRIVMTLGNRRPRPWMRASQKHPDRTAADLLDLWSAVSLVRRGRWGGWDFSAHPRIMTIEFLDDRRTHAIAEVMAGDAGATVWLVKRNERWSATGVRNYWVAESR
jgi:hypothetical protein